MRLRRWETQFLVNGAPVQERKFFRRVKAHDDFMGIVTHMLHLKAGMTAVLMHRGKPERIVTL